MERAKRRLALRHKLVSTVMVLNGMRMRRYLAGFKVGVAQTQIEGLRKQQARIQYYERLKVRTLKAFALYSVASKRNRELKKS
jgi:hypothetical protein